MTIYLLRQWLMEMYDHHEFQHEIVETHISHVKQLLALRHPELVAADLLYAAIELTHVNGGVEALLEYADYLRSMATTIERRVKRHNFQVVPKPTSPVNPPYSRGCSEAA